jgi:Zn-dependent M28 family amino/carboxypeptidase
MRARLAASLLALCVLAGGVGASAAQGGGEAMSAQAQAKPKAKGKNRAKRARPGSRDPFQRSAKLRRAVRVADIMRVLRRFQRIADRNGGSRASGEPGYDRSVDLVATAMRRSGYRVQRQRLEFEYFKEESTPQLQQVAPNQATYRHLVDFVTADYSGSGDVTGELVAVDLMLPPPEEPGSTSGCEPEDFAGLQLEGRIALLQRGTCPFATKADNAAAAGAAAAVIFNEGQPDRRGLEPVTLEPPGRAIPVVMTTFDLGEELANGVTHGPTGVTARVRTDTTSRRVEAENVIATSRRGDPNNIVMAGAHLDSVPQGPGINDNGSGAAALLEVAREVAKLKRKPKNRVRFAWWAAEEFGLVGSAHYVRHLSEEQRARIALYTNYDMLASPNFARLIYDGNGSAFKGEQLPAGSAAIERAYQRYFERKGLPTGQVQLDGRSDYLPFAAVGIPVGGLFSGAEGTKTASQQIVFGGTDGEAFDPCYHQACDDIDNVSRRALGQMSDAIAHVTWTFMNDLKFVRAQALARRAAARPLRAIEPERAGEDLVR